jgi:hypothetical protein
MPNKQKMLARIDCGKCVGLEIGPLTQPVVTKEDGEIYYLDHLSTEDLRRKYADHPTVDKSKIVEVSFVAPDGDLIRACGERRFDYVIASHVIEHIPNTIGWLHQVASLLHTGGKLALAIPDKRYTFDQFRLLTPLGDIIQCWLENRRNPSAKHVFDYCANVALADARRIWEGAGPQTADEAPHYYTLEQALQLAQHQFATDEYFDAHCHVFTPASFLDILADLTRLGLLDFICIDFQTTARYEIEFYVTLEKVYPGFDRHLQLESINRFRSAIHSEHHAGAERDENMRRIQALEAEVEQWQREARMLRQSLSWKITAPLRRIAGLLLQRGRPQGG